MSYPPPTDDIKISDMEYLDIERRSLLMMLEIIERRLGVSPRTCELRKAYREGKFLPIDNCTDKVVK